MHVFFKTCGRKNFSIKFLFCLYHQYDEGKVILNKKKYQFIIILSVSLFIISIFIIYFNSSRIEEVTIKGTDKFGIAKIYSTKDGGREWYINMDDPEQSENTFFTGLDGLFPQQDNSWRASGSAIKINVDTPQGEEEWKNIEMTGYFRIISILEGESSGEEEIGSDINMLARGGRHTKDSPCEGTSLIGTLLPNGVFNWRKEIWHTGGYTGERGSSKVTDSLLGKWIGLKVIMYNIDNDSAVKMESYIDSENNGNWTKVSEIIDNGNWYADTSNTEFFSANCGKPKNYIITNSGPIASFRVDNLVWDFKDLSVREISP